MTGLPANRGRSTSRIAWRLAVMLVLFGSVITIAATSLQLFTDYRRDVASIEDGIARIDSSYLEAIANSLWAFEDTQLSSQLEGLLRLPDMAYVAIKVDGEVRWSRGERPSGKTIAMTFPIVYTHDSRRDDLGELDVAASLDQVYRRLYDKVPVILAGNAIKIFLVSAFLFFVVHALVIRRVRRLANAMSRLDRESSVPVGDLFSRNGGKRDELDELETAVRKMHENQLESDQSLREREAQLNAILNNAPVMISLKDTGDRYILVNSGWEKTFGLRGEDVRGKLPEEVLPDGLVLSTQRHDREILESDTPSTIEETGRLAGVDHTFLTTKFPVPGSDGKTIGIGSIATDITERKREEAELEYRRTLFEAVFREIPDAMVLADPERAIVSCNPALKRIFGYEPDDVRGQKTSVLYGSVEKFEEMGRRLYNQRTEETHAPYIVEYQRADGEVFFGETVSSPLRNKTGEILGYIGVIRDITERKRAEQEIQNLNESLERRVEERTRELAAANRQLNDELAARRMAEEAVSAAETRYRDIVENSVEGIVQSTPEGKFITVNPAFARTLGYDDPEDLLNSITDIGAQIYADPRRRGELRTSIGPRGEMTASESRYVRKDGSTVWLSENARAVRDRNGEILRYESFTQDITVRKLAEIALRASEERFRKTFHASPVMICISELDSGRYHDANDSFLESMGYDRDALVGKTAYELGIWANSADRDHMIEQIGERGFVRDFEMRARTKSGTILDCLVTSTSVVLEEQERLLFFLQDITDRKRAEQALQAAQDALLRKERLAVLGELTGTVAHELRNPLGVVAASAHVLQRKCAGQDAAVRKALRLADRGIKRCDNIITELLDFARAKGLQPVPTNLEDWLSALLAEQLLPAGVTLRHDFGANDVVARFDPEELRRAVINVVDNACQAMADGRGDDGSHVKGRLIVGTRATAERIEIHVTDSGPGIPGDSLAKVLEPLYSTKAFGTGLGLPTVQRIMEEHGGGLEIDSEEGRGTRVTLWLRRRRETSVPPKA